MVFGVKNNTFFFFSFNKKLSSGFHLVLLNSGSYSPPTQFFFSRTEEPGQIKNKIILKRVYLVYLQMTDFQVNGSKFVVQFLVI